MVVVVVMIGGPVVATLSQLFLFTRGEGSVSRGGGAGRFARTHTHIHRLLMASFSSYLGSLSPRKESLNFEKETVWR